GINLSSATGTIVENNYIGTDASKTRAMGNALAGISITGSTNRIGGLGAGQPNTIQFNGGAGVEVTLSSAIGNEISGNRIYDNSGLGIDLGSSGVTTNDLSDADTGANNLQNFPVLTSAVLNSGSIQAKGTLNSTPATTFRIEFFASPAFDPTGSTEGQN